MKNTVQVYEITLDVEYDYYEGEKRTHDHSGSAPSVTILKVTAGSNENIYDVLSDVAIEKIEEILIELNN